jgi:hypothetical protein
LIHEYRLAVAAAKAPKVVPDVGATFEACRPFAQPGVPTSWSTTAIP